MNKWVKGSLLSVGLVSVMGLTACQSNPSNTQVQQHKPFKGEQKLKDDRYHGKDRRSTHMRGQDHRSLETRGEFSRIPLTEEQHAQVEKLRAERLAQHTAQKQAIQQACEGKIGQTISIKIGEKTIDGACQVQFRPISPKGGTLPQAAPQSASPTPQTAS